MLDNANGSHLSSIGMHVSYATEVRSNNPANRCGEEPELISGGGALTVEVMPRGQ